MILSINVVYFLLDYEGAKDYEGPCLKLNAVIMKDSMIMKVPTKCWDSFYDPNGSMVVGPMRSHNPLSLKSYQIGSPMKNFEKLKF